MEQELVNLGVFTIPMSQIQRNPDQPRKHFDQTKLEELAQSIKDNGLLQEIVLRQLAEGKYVIIAGERRYRATKIIEWENIGAKVVRCSDKKADELSLLENIQREDLTLIEEASGYKKLKETHGYTLAQLSKVVSKSPSSISNIVGILSEDPRVQEYVFDGTLTLAALVWIKQLPNIQEKLKVLEKLRNEELQRSKVREYVEWVKEAYKVAEQLGIDPKELMKEKKKGKGGRFDVKDDAIPEDFRFFFIIDNLVGKEDLEYFPRCRVLSSAFSYMVEKGNNKHLGQILMKRDTIEEFWMDSGVVPASKKEMWSFFDKSEQLFQFYDSVKPDICVSLDIPAYAPVLEKWRLPIAIILSRTLDNAEKFRDWEPKFPTVKVYALQGVVPEDYLWCFKEYVKRGMLDKDEKVALGFGAVARNKIELVEAKVKAVMSDPLWKEYRPKLEFVHCFGIGQVDRIVKLYQLGVNSFDALTCVIVTATGQYLLRDGKYYPHIALESPLMRRVRLHFNVNSFWNNLTAKFAEVRGMELSDDVRRGIDRGMERLGDSLGNQV